MSKHNYYSVNTYLSYKINKIFYKDSHYVWCAPNFDEDDNPPSSNPKEIYLSLLKDVKLNDKHSAKIEKNKMGLIKGANEQHKNSVITDMQRDEIHEIVAQAEISYFRPIIYVINKTEVEKNKLEEYVPRAIRADYFSNEIIIEKLPGEFFEIIDIKEL